LATNTENKKVQAQARNNGSFYGGNKKQNNVGGNHNNKNNDAGDPMDLDAATKYKTPSTTSISGEETMVSKTREATRP
jgi:hypothetical protein